jgi:peptidylprolyl isomerase
MVSLAGCSASSSATTAKPCTPTKPGAASNAITVAGKFGVKPTVTIKAPVSVKTTQRTVAITGKGTVAAAGYTVTVDYSMYNGTTGAVIDATAYNSTSAAKFPLDGTLIAGLTKTLECSTVGSRVVGVTAPADGLNASALSTYGLVATDSIVIVADVVSATKAPAVVAPLAKANGKAQALPAGFPDITVTLASNGTPTVTLPGGTPPTTVKVAVLKKGTGKVVGSDANVVVNYQGLIWATKAVFNDSWADGKVATFNTGSVIAGFKTALEGQTVGSQILVIVPPAEGYGATGQTSAGISGTDTLVFIIDVLGLS